MSFDIVDVEKMRDHLKSYAIDGFVLSPKLWSECLLPVHLNWEMVKYDRSERLKLPETAGVYTFIVKPGIANHPECSYLLYVGKTDKQTLRKRFLQYFSEEQKPKGRTHIKFMGHRYRAHLWYCFAKIDDVSLIDTIEKALICAYIPPMNREFDGIIGEGMKAW